GKDYDQQVEVRPRVGSALPVVGAVAAGPAGAALGWVMQRALEKPLGFAARTRYRVTGTWNKPTITQLPRLPSMRASRSPGTDSPAPDTDPG
ncbi:MAG: AsmA-like C-terminal region-containing protein, partial [Lysobacterales bacterium]